MSEGSDNWKNELYEAYVARQQAFEAEESEQRRQQGKVAIWLEPGPTDGHTFTREHQDVLGAVVGDLRKHAEDLDAPFMALDSIDTVGGYTGQVIIPIIQAASPVLTAVVVAWIKGKPGRKVRVQFHPSGKLKTIEAETEEQVRSLAEALDQEARVRVPKSKPE